MGKLTLKQLEALVWASRLGSFTAAAEHLEITQPTLSSRVAEMEKIVGATLFLRRGSRVVLTAEGHEANAQGEQVLDLTDRLESQLVAKNPWQMTLRLGSSGVFAATALPSVIDIARTAHPDFDVDLTVSSSARLSRMLSLGKIDAAFLSNPEPREGITAFPLATINVAFVSHQRERLPEAVTPEDLVSRRLLTNPEPSAIHSAVRRWFQNASLYPTRQSTCNSLPATCRLVESGVGVGAIPAPMIRQYMSSAEITVHQAVPPLRQLHHALVVSDAIGNDVTAFLLRVGRIVATFTGEK